VVRRGGWIAAVSNVQEEKASLRTSEIR